MSPRQRKNDKKLPVFKYFDDSTDPDKVICIYCKRPMKRDRSNNLKKHLQRHGVYVSSKIKKKKSKNHQDEMAEVSTIKIELSQAQLIRSYIDLVVKDNIPLHILDSNNFKNIFDPICTALNEKTTKAIKLSAENCVATINLVADLVRAGLKSLIKHRLLSIKLECAGKNILPNKNLLFISTQFVSNDEIKSVILGVIELKEGNDLTGEIVKTLHKYDIKLEHIISFTTNNNTYLFGAMSKKKGNSQGNDTAFEKPDQLRIGDIEVRVCAASIAQQCTLDIINNAEIRKHLKECNELTKYVRKTENAAYDDVDEIQHLELDQINGSPMSWCKNYTIISELLSAKETLNGIKSYRSELHNEKIEITDTLWDFMDSYCTVFYPLYKALQKFEEEHMHIGNFYAQWLKCQILTEKIFEKCASTAKDSFKYKLCQLIVERIKNVTQTLLKQDPFIACLYMDPRFQHTLNPIQRQNANVFLKKLWDKLGNLSNAPIKVEPGVEPESVEHNEFSDIEDEMLNNFLAQELETTQITCSDIHTKIESLRLPYLRSDANVLQYWKERKDVDADMYALSSVCFGMPATQVSHAHEASGLSALLANYKNGLALETMENILLVKLNPQYLDEAIEQLPLFEYEVMEVE